MITEQLFLREGGPIDFSHFQHQVSHVQCQVRTHRSATRSVTSL